MLSGCVGLQKLVMDRCRFGCGIVDDEAAEAEVVCWDSNGNATCGIHGSDDDELVDAESDGAEACIR